MTITVSTVYVGVLVFQFARSMWQSRNTDLSLLTEGWLQERVADPYFALGFKLFVAFMLAVLWPVVLPLDGAAKLFPRWYARGFQRFMKRAGSGIEITGPGTVRDCMHCGAETEHGGFSFSAKEVALFEREYCSDAFAESDAAFHVLAYCPNETCGRSAHQHFLKSLAFLEFPTVADQAVTIAHDLMHRCGFEDSATFLFYAFGPAELVPGPAAMVEQMRDYAFAKPLPYEMAVIPASAFASSSEGASPNSFAAASIFALP